MKYFAILAVALMLNTVSPIWAPGSEPSFYGFSHFKNLSTLHPGESTSLVIKIENADKIDLYDIVPKISLYPEESASYVTINTDSLSALYSGRIGTINVTISADSELPIKDIQLSTYFTAKDKNGIIRIGGWSAPFGNTIKVESKLDPPLQQFKSGVPIDKIQCKEGLILAVKYNNNSPICIRSETKQKLVDRDWMFHANYQDHVAREVGYIGLYTMLPYFKSDMIVISLEGRPDFVKQIVDSYNVEIISGKKTPDESFSSSFGKITKDNLRKFFEDDPLNHFLKRGLSIASVGGFVDDSGTHGPFNELPEEQEQRIGKLLEEYEKRRMSGQNVEWGEIAQWRSSK